ncbi:MAG: DNA methyltransferase [Pyrinomonadaceae bacterium]
MQPVLLQEKLDVTRKTRANLFNWRGQFTPELIEYLLCCYSSSGDVVADPFSGSGTVLLESARKNLSCAGFEINPAAYAMSKFYSFSNLEQIKRKDILIGLERKVLKLIKPSSALPVVSASGTFRDQYKNLLDFTRDLFAELENKFEKILALNMLFMCERHRNYDLGSSVLASLDYIKKAALSLPLTDQLISAQLCDARTVHLHSSPNLIITSPPYINVFNYHQNHRAILETIGWDMLAVAQSEFGSNRKNRGNRFRTVVQYCLDMEQALCSFWQCLQENGLIAIVVGRESNVRSSPFYNGQIVKEIINALGCFESVTDRERTFVNKFGASIKEDIIISKKVPSLPHRSVSKMVSVKHLEDALNLAPLEVRKDITDAISNIDSVDPSPLFTVQNAFQHA